MKPLTKLKLIKELKEREVQLGVAEKVSWHSEYKDSAWIFMGRLPYELHKGDVICVLYQQKGKNENEEKLEVQPDPPVSSSSLHHPEE